MPLCSRFSYRCWRSSLPACAAHRQASNLPVIVITGESTEANAIEALNLGVTGYITKPFRMERVLARVAKALGEPVPRADD